MMMFSWLKHSFLSLLFFIFLNFFSQTVYAVNFINAGPPFINIEKVGLDKLARTKAILQDSKGYIWLLTQEGFFRYDGQTLKLFPGLEQVTTNNVGGIASGQNGRLWFISINNGLGVFDGQSEKLTFFNLQEKFSIATDIDRAKDPKLAYKNGRLYLASNKKILVLDEKNLTIEQEIPLSIAENDTVIQILVTNNGHIWASTKKGNGVLHYNKKTWQRYQHDPDNETTINGKFVANIYEDNRGRIWFGTLYGLGLFVKESKSFVRYQPLDLTLEINHSFDPRINLVAGLAEDELGNLWLGSPQIGIFKFTPETEAFEHFPHVNGVSTTLSTNKLASVSKNILIDKQYNLWAITTKGISKLPLLNREIKSWANTAQDNCTPSLIQEMSKGLFFACGNNVYQIKDNQVTLLTSVGKRINSIFIGKNQTLWLGTRGAGIYRYNLATNNTKHYTFSDKKTNENSVKSIRSDSNGDIYALIQEHPDKKGYGVLRYDPATDTFLNFATGDQFTKLIDIDKDRLMLFSGYSNKSKKLFWFNKHNQKIEQLPIITGRILAAVKWNKQLWLSTQKLGMINIDISTGKWHKLSTDIADQITGLYVDNSSDKLFFTNKDNLLSLDSFHNNNVKTRCITCALAINHSGFNNIGFGQLYESNVFLMNNGEFIIATENALTSLNLNSYNNTDSNSQLLLTDYKVMGQSVIPAPGSPDALLEKSIDQTSKIVIPSMTTYFSFNFAQVTASHPEKVQYAYQMKGFSDNWIYTNSEQAQAVYSSLPAGSYVFQVKSTNEKGQWNNDLIPLEVIVLPAWWQTWWAYSIYLIVFLMLFGGYHRIRLTQQKQQSALKVAIAKEQLFANLSHEFRTPLTLIIGPAKVIKNDIEHVHTQHNINLIERNAQRLLSMVDQLLLLAHLKEQNNVLLEDQQVSEICHFVVQTFEVIAKEKDIVLTLDGTIDDALWVSASKNALETILYNLFTNAVKFTQSQGVISLNVEENEQWVQFKITDSGCGISTSEQTRIFERFTRLENSHNTPGVGIGLALVKELVNTLGGEIHVESELHVGSTFTFSLPKVLGRSGSTQPSANSPIFPSIEPLSLIEMNQVNQTQLGQTTFIGDENNTGENNKERQSVLIVDDNQEMRHFIRQQLASIYNIMEATNGQQGFSLACEHSPDIIISDVMMPGMDGFQLLSAIRNEMIVSHIPVILLTAKGDQESKLSGLSGLADDYITKPFDAQELLLSMRRIIQVRSILQSRFKHSMLAENLPKKLVDVTGEQFMPPKKIDDLPHKDQQFLHNFNLLIEQGYADSTLTISVVSSKLAMGERQLQRKLQAISGFSFNEILRDYRLTQGCALLSEGGQIAVIADQVGFGSSNYFVRCFKAKYGHTPNEYRKITMQ